jgi:aryl-alcohol dehydrogenase-like predicted oxidoreductase
MRTRTLGSRGPEISVIGYGAWEAGGEMWGSPIEQDHVVAAMHSAIDAGVNWIDTAEAYGDGRSEELVGKVLRERRSEVLVFTKVAHFASGARAGDVRRAVVGSLERLDVEAIDLYQVHWPAEHVCPIEETWGAMAELVDEGLVRHIGVSNFDRPLIERCLAIHPVASVQNQCSLLHADDRADLLPWLADRGIAYLAYGPLAYGLLGGTMTKDTTFADDDWRSGRRWVMGYYDELFAPGPFERNIERVERLRPIADRLGVGIPSLALAALTAMRGVTGVIAGSRSADHARENAAAADLDLDDRTIEEIERAVDLA